MKELSQNETIGKYIHDLRIKNKMTLKQLSEKVNLSPGFLSQLERGYTTFSLNTLSALADVFSTDLSCFFTQETSSDSEQCVARNYKRANLRISKGFQQYTLFSQMHSSKMNPEIYEIYPVNEYSETVVFCHKEEEFMFLLNGSLEITLGDDVFILNPHDSIYVPPNTPHSWKNITDNMVILLGVSVNP